MQIPETPNTVEELDLMKRLAAYVTGKQSWDPAHAVGDDAKSACQTLHANIVQLVHKALAPLLDRISAREMDTFTMHDRKHGLKVAHVMWHILDPQRRGLLTPPEIAMLVLSAHLHDVGMALSRVEREARLQAGSDLWDKLEVQESTKTRMDQLRHQVGDANLTETIRRRAKIELDRAEEALLCQDTRERHATRERYEEIREALEEFHQKDRNIPSLEECLSFDGDSFRNKLIDICVSHNEDAEALVRRDHENPERSRFPRDFPVGCCTADLHLIAAALRLADILDFDRERTPAILFHYLIPGPLSPQDNRSVLEWRKHMAISNWYMDEEAIVFRAQCRDHIIHHAVVQFCWLIQEEISSTRTTFGTLEEKPAWPFQLPSSVKANIHEDGYRYVPYRFELDDQRIYELLMGGAIYDNPLVAVRELVQNAVDACALRDALTQLYDQAKPIGTDRITVRYEEPGGNSLQSILSVTDTGTGMDKVTLERYFLRVGQSYYRSAEFNLDRVNLRKKGFDFAPVSEFGIGFLSCFLLADRVKVETAMWEPRRGDTRKRTLIIDGPTRLIRLEEHSNEGIRRSRGTRITLYLTRGSRRERGSGAPSWEEIRDYLEDVCQDLPYRLNLEHVTSSGTTQLWIDRKPLTVSLPPHLESSVIRIQVADAESGIEGEIAIINGSTARKAEAELFEASPAVVKSPDASSKRLVYSPFGESSALLRGGFRISAVPGLPFDYRFADVESARVRLVWNSTSTRRYPAPNLARNALPQSETLAVANSILRIWLSYLLEHVDQLPHGLVYSLVVGGVGALLQKCSWLEHYDALIIYGLASQGWHLELKAKKSDSWETAYSQDQITAWEDGFGDSLPLPSNSGDIYAYLLDFILPRITTLQMDWLGHFFVKPPQSDWKAICEGWREYITAPVTWGPYAEFVGKIGKINDLLAYNFSTRLTLNIRFRDRFRGFNDEELLSLVRVFEKLLNAATYKSPAGLAPAEAILIRRIQAIAGDLKIGSNEGSWRLDSFNIPEPS